MTDTLSPVADEALRTGGPAALVRLARRHRGPIVEPASDPGAVHVTFVFADPGAALGSAALVCPAVPGGFARLAALGEGVFAGAFVFPAGTRVKYHFCPDPPDTPDAAAAFAVAHSPRAWRIDRLNPHYDRVHLRGLRVRIVESLLTVPGADEPLPTAPRPGVPTGSVEELAIDSRALGRRKEGLIYRPADEQAGSGPLPVVLLLQGNEEWQQTGYFDNLIAAGQVRPFVAVLFRERSFTVRLREFSGGPAHNRFVVDELWPLLDRRGLLSAQPATVAGFSVGGLGAASLAIAEPELFSRLAVVSGALHLAPVTDLHHVTDGNAELPWRLERAAAVPERAYVAVGQFEDAWEKSLYRNAAQLVELLREHGATVRFDTGPTGHDGVSARAYLGAGLGWLLAG